MKTMNTPPSTWDVCPSPFITGLYIESTTIVTRDPTRLPQPWLANMYASIVPRLRTIVRSEVTDADIGWSPPTPTPRPIRQTQSQIKALSEVIDPSDAGLITQSEQSGE